MPRGLWIDVCYCGVGLGPNPVLKTALITGIAGQDGSYLAELLLARGYRVVGTDHARDHADLWRIAHLRDRLDLVHADMGSQTELTRLIEATAPDEVYNLAAQSFIPASWKDPVATAEVNALAAARLLEAVRHVNPAIRFYQASSSEIFGAVHSSPQNESTPLRPRTPYGSAKAYGHFLTANYRDAHGLFACSGILYNHESPRRAPGFVTRKITMAVAAIRQGRQRELLLGSTDARRDWGFAGDYVRAMWLMLQSDSPADYVIASGHLHSVAEFVEAAFAHAGLDWRDHVRSDPALIRPAEQVQLVGDASKARRELGWTPEVDFPRLVALMVDADLDSPVPRP